MLTIYLKQTTSYDDGRVTVACEDYIHSNLFTRYKHIPTSDRPWKPGEQIKISNNELTTLLTLKPDGEYRDEQLEHAYVYFNRFDTGHNHPLLLTLHFKNESPKTKFMYLQYSEFRDRLRSRREINISDLSELINENSLYSFLISENFSSNNSLSYQLEQKGREPTGTTYSNQVNVSSKNDVQTGEPHGFHKYIHTSKNGVKKSYILYNKHVLAKEDKSAITEIQGKEYKEITVYFGTKVKTQEYREFLPLLIEFVKESLPKEHDYYIIRRKNTNYFWEKLNKINLKNILEDIGFSLVEGQSRYQALTSLVSGVSGASLSYGHASPFNNNEIKGSKLKKRLDKPVGGKGPGIPTLLVLLLKKIEFDLFDSLIILLDKREKDRKYNSSLISSVLRSLDPIRHINLVNLIKGGSKNITVSDRSGIDDKCAKNYGYKLLEHDLSEASHILGDPSKNFIGIRFLIPSKTKVAHYNQLTFYSDENTEPQHIEYTFYNKGHNGIYVYYYREDFRPLLICYGNTLYQPKKLGDPQQKVQVRVDYSKWVKVTSLTQCTCQTDGLEGPNAKLLNSLTQVVGYLNPVQINPKQLPNPSNSLITSTSITSEYILHKYSPTVTIKMGISREDIKCYKKFQYQPYGTGIQYSANFRLGDIIYTATTGGKPKGTLKYIADSSNKYEPLISVTVYYYDRDTDYADPLLIELEFKTNGGGGTGPKEYYKLQPGNVGSNGTLKWQLDPTASSAINGGGGGDNTQKFVNYLNGIRYSLKKILRIQIDKNTTTEYNLTARSSSIPESGFSDISYNKKIQVIECNEGGCSKLKANNYVCLQHKVSAIEDLQQYHIAGFAMTLSGKTNNQVVEIPIYNENKDGIVNGQQKYLYYNSCMGDVYVYFYLNPVSKKADTVPLMVFFNGNFYEPESRDEYFKTWSRQLVLQDVKNPCGSDVEDDNINELISGMLDLINKALNRIDLRKHTDYGIPASQPPPKNPNIELERIKVTKIPGKPETRPYCKLVHRTINDFTIGDIWYSTQDIKSGVKINGDSGTGDRIEVSSPNHTTEFLSTSSNNTPNTVVAYYHIGDNEYKLPQLIVLLHTDKGIEPISATKTITASRGSKYGYYVLATNGGGNTYKYEWRTDSTGSKFQLDDTTEFSLLNSIVILVDKQDVYDDGDISSAVQNANFVRSPGNINDVNRFMEKSIYAREETGSDAQRYGKPGQCISQYGYKLYAHDITALVQWSSTIQLPIPLIGGLRFLISSSYNAAGYQEITLNKDPEAQDSIDLLYHKPKTNHNNSQNKVYIFFYGSDPRPLIICYGNGAYIPKKNGEPTPGNQVDVDYTKWTLESKINQCTCTGENVISEPNKSILDTLLDVVLFLNPVQINPRKLHSFTSSQITKPLEPPETHKNLTYNLHKYKYSSHVKMKITRTDVACYEKYIYEPNGTNGSGTGFRLGNVIYDFGTGGGKPKGTVNYYEFSPWSKYLSLVKVTVYYYDHDKQYKEPLLIELMFKFDWYFETSYKKEYYKLDSVTGTGPSDMKWTIDSAARGAIGDGKDGDTQKIVTYLDKIRYRFKKVLEIKIAIKQETHYSANLLDKNSVQPVESEPPIQVHVTEETNSGSISGTGFRCFKHQITKVGPENLHKFAALQFFIPNQQGETVKLQLYGPPRTGLLNQLYYNCSMGDIYVYFYGTGTSTNGGKTDQDDGDPRPLLLCYNKQAFRAWCMETYDNHSWYRATQIKNCLCNKPGDEFLLRGLVRVTNFLNPVKLNITQGIYKIHAFNGKEISIKVSVTKAENKFCYNKYTHTHNGTGNSPKSGKGFRLGNITYNSEWIIDKDHPQKSITSLTTRSPKYEPASEVVVYYYGGDKNHKNPLLVVLCKNGDSPSSNTISISKQYYELQRSDYPTITKKVYKKETTPLDLNPSKNGKLEQLLDRILFSISKRLQIILGERPNPIPLCPIERKRIKFLETKKPLDQLSYEDIGLQLLTNAVFGAAEMSQYMVEEGLLQYKNPKSYDYINKGSCKERENNEWDPKITTRIPTYKARVYNNTGTQEKGDSGTTQIKVQKVDCPDLANAGYVCYQHLLTQIKDIDNFGGLRLFLWDNRGPEEDKGQDECKIKQPSTNTKHECCELDLHGEDSQPVQPIAYTTCKGDLYVYFYGSDPRPMLLCYNGQSYAPQSLDDYNQKWCLVKTIKSCECDGKAFDPSSVLQQLYQISMFLNPVRLWETLKAYEKVKQFIEEEKQKQEQAKKTGKEIPKIGKLPDHIYKVQTFGDTDINIKVKSADLNCYRQYTFESAMGDSGSSVRRDYRLGDIYYGSDQNSKRGADSTCLKYPQERRLQSVSLYYYMYDLQHRYPLIIQLDYGFGGELDDYFRVCKIGAGQGVGGANGGGGSSGTNGGGGGPGGGAPSAGAPPTPSATEIAKKITWVKIKCTDTTHVHSQDDPGQGSSSASSTTGTGTCKDDCKTPTDYTGKPLGDETVKELKENDARFVKEAHMVQGKIRDLSQGDPTYGKWYMDVSSLFNHYYMDYVSELQALIEARCYDVRRKYGIEYPKGEKNENLIMVSDENCYEESIMGYLLGGGALGVAGGGGWKLATFVLTLFIKV